MYIGSGRLAESGMLVKHLPVELRFRSRPYRSPAPPAHVRFFERLWGLLVPSERSSNEPRYLSKG